MKMKKKVRVWERRVRIKIKHLIIAWI
jgi:hypothetical protein